MTPDQWPAEFLAFLARITGKRARVVIDHILQHGYITTEELKEQYGYNHPPRAARDVREQGVPLVTFLVEDSDGRQIAAYRFGDPSDVEYGKLGGRKTIPKQVKTELIEQNRPRCAICLEEYDTNYLQVDHRVPYEIAGDANRAAHSAGDFMLLCGACNRAKSWTCEHCPNQPQKSIMTCQTCYWASPVQYTHIATQAVRRVDVV